MPSFFTIPLDPQCQDLFAFTWTDPETRHSQQLTWMVLPQGFRDSPHLFGQAQAKDLRDRALPRSSLLQYVDDLLLCSPDLQTSQENMCLLLNFLTQRGYRVSATKAQLSQSAVTYLRVRISQDRKEITADRKSLISSLPMPTTKSDLLSFLEVAGFLCSWIPSYSNLARPLYEAMKGDPNEPLDPSKLIESAFKYLQQALVQAPALHLPDLSWPFILYTHENHGLALRVLGQDKGPSFAPVAYLSKQLDPTSRGWAPCLRALGAAATLALESSKLTFGQHTTIKSPHHLQDLVTHKAIHHLSPSRLQAYRLVFIENRQFSFTPCSPLNLATLLPVGTDPPLHSCIETITQFLSPFPHISPTPLSTPEQTLYIDGSSTRTKEGLYKAGYAIVSSDPSIIEANPLPPTPHQHNISASGTHSPYQSPNHLGWQVHKYLH